MFHGTSLCESTKTSDIRSASFLNFFTDHGQGFENRHSPLLKRISLPTFSSLVCLLILYKLCVFPVSHIAIPSENFYAIVIHPHREWGCASPRMHILTGKTHSLYRALLHVKENAQ